MQATFRDIWAGLRSGLLLTIAIATPGLVHAQPSTRYYSERFENVDKATKAMVNNLANASLDSACLTKPNFEKATASLDDDSKATAIAMRDVGIRTLNETKSWNTCKDQREQSIKLAADMSSAAAWKTARDAAKRSALLAENEEIENGILVDRIAKTPVTSNARSAVHVSADLLLGSRYGLRGQFDAVLTVSEEGLVTACEVISSIGREFTDSSICRKAQTLMRYRPAFANGRVVASTTRLRVSVED